MKNDKKQPQTEKRSVNDFEHRLTVQLEEKHYVDYAMAHSKDQIKSGRKKAVLCAVFFTVLGVIALFKGASLETRWSDVYLTAGIILIVFQIFNLFYNYIMFPVALKRSIIKELKKDPSLLSAMEYAFEPDKIVCFIGGKHRSTVLTQDISGVEETSETLIIEVKDGKRIIVPKTAFQSADSTVQAQIRSFKK